MQEIALPADPQPHLPPEPVSHEWRLENLLLAAAIFLAGTLAVWLAIPAMNYQWDDSSGIIALERHFSDQDGWALYRWHLATDWKDTADDTGTYRPLGNAVTFAVFLLRDYPRVMFLTSAATLASAGAVIFLLIVELTRRRAVALGTSFFFMLAVPTLAMSFLVLNKQAIVPLLISLGLLFYERFRQQRHWGWLVVLAVVGLIGPWYREFTGLLPAVLLVMLLLQRPRSIGLAILAVVLLFHAIYPSFLVNLLAFGHLVLNPIFGRGVTLFRGQIPNWHSYHWDIAGHLVFLLPPMLVGLAILVASLVSFADAARSTSSRPALPPLRMVLAAGCALVLGTAFVFAFYHHVPVWHLGWKIPRVLPLCGVMLLGLLSFRFNRLLPVWLAGALLPFLRLYTEEVHLTTALVPFAAIVLLWIDEGRRRARDIGFPHVHFLAVAVTIAVVGWSVVAQSANLWTVRRAFAATNRNIRQMGDYARDNLPPGGIVVANFHHILDTAHYARWYFQPVVGIPLTGMPGDLIAADEPALGQVLSQAKSRQVYFLLETAGWYPSAQPYYYPPRLAQPAGGTLQRLQDFTVQTGYSTLDPLWNLADEEYLSFPGPPDLISFFRVQPHGRFARRYSARFELYRYWPQGQEESFSPAFVPRGRLN